MTKLLQVLAFLFALYLVAPAAHAQAASGCTNPNAPGHYYVCTTQAQAEGAVAGVSQPQDGFFYCTGAATAVYETPVNSPPPTSGSSGNVQGFFHCTDSPTNHVLYVQADYTEASPNQCATGQSAFEGSVDMGSGSSGHSFFTCKAGCEFYAGGGIEVGTKFSGMFYPMPGGVQCSPGTGHPAPAGTGSNDSAGSCIPDGTLTTCYRSSDGKVCAVTPRGAKACWSPSETGTKVSPDQSEGLSKQPAGTTPPDVTPLKPAETDGVATHTGDSSSTQDSSPQIIIYYNQTGQAGTGTTGTDSSGSATGGDPASSGGSGSTNGSGGTACPAGTDCTGAGSPGGVASSSDLYTPSGDTFASVFAEYKAGVEETEVYSATIGFFEVDNVSGQCPALGMASWQFMGYSFPALSFNWHCTGAFALALQGVGFFLVILAAWAAFNWAFY